MSEKPFSTRALADRWGCSQQHIRNLIKEDKLRSFKLGELVRIPYSEVERVECDLSNTEKRGAQSGQKEQKPVERPFIPKTVPLLKDVSKTL